MSLDEQPAKGDVAKIPTLKPAFSKDGTITAANASSISDGAAALVMTRANVANRLSITPIARVMAHAAHAHAPSLFTTAPVFAMRNLGLPHDKVNIHGGACALGHPIGASGARILATLLSALETTGP